jgi:hypothetical protein
MTPDPSASPRRRRTVLGTAAAGAAAAALLLAGCGSSSKSSSADTGSAVTTAPASSVPASNGGTDTGSVAPTELPIFEIDAEGDGTTMSYKFPKATAPSGWVDVRLVNQDEQMSHETQLFLLHDGATPDQFTQALNGPAGEGGVISMADPTGGPNATAPGGTSDNYVDLKPGATYMVICPITGPDGKPHYDHGMIGHFSVSTTPGTTSEPAAQSTVTMKDFEFDVPDSVNWYGTVKVVNDGTQPHELGILKPAQGHTVEDIENYFKGAPTGPPPFVGAGGVAAIAPHANQTFVSSLQPGDYLLICFVVDPKTHKPHFMLGMTKAIHVS